MDGDVALTDRSVRLDPGSAERLARLCSQLGSSAEQVVSDGLALLEQVLEDEEAHPHAWSPEDDAAMRRAIAEFEHGGGVPHEQVMADARARLGR